MTDAAEPGGANARPEATDIELLTRCREGDSAAYAELYSRYWSGAVRYAVTVSSRLDPEDVAAEAFARVWSAIRGGGGPTEAFRPYLHQAVRNYALNAVMRSREVPTQPEIIESVLDTTEMGFDEVTVGFAEARHVAAAFNSLPERWQKVLWLTQVEELGIAEVAARLDIRPNAASALLLRSREGLRNAWLEQQLKRVDAQPECEWTAAHLGAFVRDRSNTAHRERVQRHLDTCDECAATRSKAIVISASLKTVAAVGSVSGLGTAAWLAAQGGGAASQARSPGQPAPMLMTSGRWIAQAAQNTLSRLGTAPVGIGITVAATAAAIVGAAALVVVPALAGANAGPTDAGELAAAAAPTAQSPGGNPTTTATSPSSASSSPSASASTASTTPSATPTSTPTPSATPTRRPARVRPATKPPKRRVTHHGRRGRPSASPTPTPVPSPRPTPTWSPTQSPTPWPTWSPTPWPTPTWSPTWSPTPWPTPTWSPTWSPTSWPTPTWSPSWTLTPSASPTSDPTPTASPTESETPSPTPSPSGSEDSSTLPPAP